MDLGIQPRISALAAINIAKRSLDLRRRQRMRRGCAITWRASACIAPDAAFPLPEVLRPKPLDGPPGRHAWRVSTVSTLTRLPVRVMNPPSFQARTVGITSTLSTRNAAAFHPVLKFHLFRDAWVWHPHCLNRMGRRARRTVLLFATEPCNEEIQRLASRLIKGGTIT